jgi:8-oxo-dGTP pyrophosphatase MutT (NUDIX family)
MPVAAGGDLGAALAWPFDLAELQPSERRYLGFAMPTLHQIRTQLAAAEPAVIDPAGRATAAVAVVLREAGPHPEVLFIERATHEGDPWSGQMAFPGGRVDAGDPNALEAAKRETLEEVGLSLEGAEYLGRIDDQEGRPAGPAGGLVISAHAFCVEDPGPLVPEEREVASAFWFPVANLLDPARHIDYRYPARQNMNFPGIVVGDPDRHVVWGLTYRFLEIFLATVDRPLPPRWSDLHKV